MSFQLTAGGGDMVIRRDLGTPIAVQGFRAESITYGGRLSTPQFGYVRMQVGDGSSQSYSPATTLWLNVLGVWKQVTTWLNVSGVWKIIAWFINVSGVWK
jgi:hypothetical protein